MKKIFKKIMCFTILGTLTINLTACSIEEINIIILHILFPYKKS